MQKGRAVHMWMIYAFLSAVFAAATSILAKMGMEGVNSNIATAIRTVVVLIMAWGIVFFTGRQAEIANITGKSWVFLIVSGVATGLSWICYFKALQTGNAAQVVPIDKFSVVITMVLAFFFLHEHASVKTVVGGLLITAGTVLTALG